MQPILANYTASITELKKSPTQLLKDAGDEAVAILNHNVASAYLVPSHIYEKMMEELKSKIKLKNHLRLKFYFLKFFDYIKTKDSHLFYIVAHYDLY